MSAEEERKLNENAVMVFIFLIGFTCLLGTLAVIMAICYGTFVDPNEKINVMTCTVLQTKLNCEPCHSTHTCCHALLKVDPGTLFDKNTFNTNRTTEEFSDDSTYASLTVGSSTTCYVGNNPQDTSALLRKYDGIRNGFKTTAIASGSIAIVCLVGVMLSPFFAKTVH
ncbi:hypothetical protein ABK040_010999 [Willaertia magna]